MALQLCNILLIYAFTIVDLYIILEVLFTYIRINNKDYIIYNKQYPHVVVFLTWG